MILSVCAFVLQSLNVRNGSHVYVYVYIVLYVETVKVQKKIDTNGVKMSSHMTWICNAFVQVFAFMTCSIKI